MNAEVNMIVNRVCNTVFFYINAFTFNGRLKDMSSLKKEKLLKIIMKMWLILLKYIVIYCIKEFILRK